jgi:hypothetical protein
MGSSAPECAAGCGQPSPSAVICAACTGSLRAALELAASIAPDLGDAIARQLRHGTLAAGRRDGQPLPYDLAASQAAVRLRAALLAAVCAVKGESEPWPQHSHEPAIGVWAAWLARRVQRLAMAPDAAGIAFDVHHAVDRAVMVLDPPPDRVYAGPCPDCHADVLGQPGAPVARCKGCGRTVEVAAQQDAMRAAMDDMLFTAAQLVSMAAYLGQPVSEHTVRSWVRRRQLVARGEWPRENGEPSATYRFGDVLILIARSNRVRG